MALTAEQILIEQRYWNSRSGVPFFHIYQRIAPSPTNRWLCSEMRQIQSNPNFMGIYDQIVYSIHEGAYFSVLADYTFPDTIWMAGGLDPWNYTQNLNATTYRSQVSIPAGTTKLYMLGYASTAGDSADLTITGGILDVNSVDTAADADFGPNGEVSNREWLLVASGAIGGETLTITPAGTAGKSFRLIGCIAVNENAIADPDTGVIHPGEAAYVQFPSQASHGIFLLASDSHVVGAWFGEDHWDNDAAGDDVTLVNETQTFTYDVGNAWSPSADTWVRQAATVFVRRLIGTAKFGSGLADAGIYVCDIVFDPSAVRTPTAITWSADAATDNLRISAAGSGADGGYCGMWGLDSSFDEFRREPLDSIYTSVGPPFDESAVLSHNGGTLIGRAGDLIATLQSYSSFGGGVLRVVKRSAGFFKMYRSQMIDGSTNYAVSSGEISMWGSTRQLLQESLLPTILVNGVEQDKTATIEVSRREHAIVVHGLGLTNDDLEINIKGAYGHGTNAMRIR